MSLSLEYIAAFLDCDGSATIVKSNRKNGRCVYYGKINFYSQNLSVLDKIKEVVRGTITPPNFSLDVFTLQLSPVDSTECARLLTPFLQIKREQALVLVELDHIKKTTPNQLRKTGEGSKGGALPMSAEHLQLRHNLYLKIRELNHEDAKAFRTNRVNSAKLPDDGTIPSQAPAGTVTGEGVTTRGLSPNNNDLHELPARKGRDSLSSAEIVPIKNALKCG